MAACSYATIGWFCVYRNYCPGKTCVIQGNLGFCPGMSVSEVGKYAVVEVAQSTTFNLLYVTNLTIKVPHPGAHF